MFILWVVHLRNNFFTGVAIAEHDLYANVYSVGCTFMKQLFTGFATAKHK